MSFRTVDLSNADLAELVALAEAGETVMIAKLGTTVAQLTPITSPPVDDKKLRRSRLGGLEGQFSIPDDFDTMGQAEIEAMFGL
jgi:antitoxin (DNA-binding transcriptional repressor) of toxin-antitoxin stability system